MEPDFFQKVAGYINTRYHELVAACASDTPPEVEEAVAVLGFAQRTSPQLAADVQRLRARRADAGVLQELVEPDSQLEAAEKRYEAAVQRKNELIEAVEAAAKFDDEDAAGQKLYDSAICAAADGAMEATAALDDLTAIRKRRDDTRLEVERRLRASAAEVEKWSDPNNFSLQ